MIAASTPVELIHSPSQAAAMLDPIRMQLLDRLREPDSAAGLARKMKLPRQKLNYHLRELEKEGLLELVEERRKGNCIERVLRATARSFVIDPAVLGNLGANPRELQDSFSSSYLIALAAKAIRDVAGLRARAQRAGKRLATFSLQSEVRFASAESRAAFFEELTAAIARLVSKYHDESEPSGRQFELVLGSYPAVQNSRVPGGGEEKPQ